MAEFEYEPVAGFFLSFGTSLSGYSTKLDGDDFEPCKTMVEVEETMQDFGEEFVEETGAAIVKVRGDQGWREYTWSNGAVHRWEWKHHLMDMRCSHCKSADNDLYMVKDGVWEESGLDGWTCFRCLEDAIDRRLEPADFIEDIPANTDHDRFHGPELRGRISPT
jgi:hypothetical protein